MPDEPIRPIQIPQSIPESFSNPFPANLPAEQCLALLRAGRAVRYEARERAEVCIEINRLGRSSRLTIPGRWVVMAVTDGEGTLALLNLSEEQARDRAAQLNKPGMPSGFHSAN